MIIDTSSGKVKGIEMNGVHVFRGIPYAAPPIGRLRFKPPEPPKPWASVRLCDSFGPISPQKQNAQEFFPHQIQSEDCLSLNVSTSGTGRLQPVAVYIHGGGFTVGTGAEYEGIRYASEDCIVYVSLNYRLGALGFLYLGDLLGSGYESSGNCGILDIVAALNWVQMNIEAFGGDPRRVTVIGNSAGAKCTAALYAIPAADGLFSGAVAQSGATQAIRNPDTASETARKLLNHLGLQCNEASRLLDLPVERIIEAQIKAGPDLSSNLHMFGPVADDIIIPQEPLAYVRSRKNLPALLLGTNEDEAEIFIRNEPDLHVPNPEAVNRLFGLNGPIVWSVYQSYASKIQPQEAWKKALTEHIYTIGTIQFANAVAESGAAVWMYRLTYGGPCGAIHGYENGLINQASGGYGLEVALDDPYHVTAEGWFLGRKMRTFWKAFMHSGDPNVPELPHWPIYDAERSTMMLDLECRIRTDLPVPAGAYCPHPVWNTGS